MELFLIFTPDPPIPPLPHPFPIDEVLFLPDIFRNIFLGLSSLEIIIILLLALKNSIIFVLYNVWL